MYLNYNHIYIFIHIQIYTKHKNQPSNQPTQLCFFLTFRPSNPPFSLRKGVIPRGKVHASYPTPVSASMAGEVGETGETTWRMGCQWMDQWLLPSFHNPLVQWKMGASPGRCVVYISPNGLFYTEPGGYGRKGRITPIYKPFFLKAIWKGSNPTGSLGDLPTITMVINHLHPSVLGAHPPRGTLASLLCPASGWVR